MTSLASSILALTLLAAIPAPTSPPATVVVHMRHFHFYPAELTVTVGETVTFENDDDYGHTVTADDKSFDSGDVPGHASWTRIFKHSGTYAYSCFYHLPGMKGVVTVVDAKP